MAKSIPPTCPTLKELGGFTGEFLRHVDPDNLKWTAFNPCIAYSPEYGYAMTIRSSNYTLDERTGLLSTTVGSRVKNDLWFAKLDQDTLQLVSRRKVQFDSEGPTVSRGVEDARLFWKDDSWYFTAIMLEKEHTRYTRVALYKYDQTTNVATFIKKYDSYDVFTPEKNWMAPLSPNPNFEFVTGPTTTYKDGVFTSRASNVAAVGGLRGGTNLLDLGDGTYLALVHTTYTKKFEEFNKNTYSITHAALKRYTHQFARFDAYGKIIELSKEFFFEAFAVEFAIGLVEKEDQYVITYGRKDQTAHMAVIRKDIVKSLLEPVEETYEF